MKKVFLYISFVILAFVMIAVVAMLVYSKRHHMTARQEVVEFINRELGDGISFDDLHLSYLSHFPRVKVSLDSLVAKDGQAEILRVGRLDILLNLWSLWNNELEIEKLIARDAALTSVIDSLGNKPRLKASGDGSTGKRKLIIESHDLEILNLKILLGNQVKGNRTYVQIDKGRLELNVSDTSFIITGGLTGQLDSLISNNKLLFANQPVRAREVVVSIDRATGEIMMSGGYLLAHELRLVPRLKMTPHEDGNLIELIISGEDTFDEYLSLFELNSGLKFAQVNPEARLVLSYNQHGFVNPFLRPYSEVIFEVHDAEITNDDMPYPVKNIFIIGNYNNGEEHRAESARLFVDTIHAEIAESSIDGHFRMWDLKDPVIDAEIRSVINLDHLFKDSDKLSTAGSVSLDLLINGRLSELRQLHLEGKQHAVATIFVDALDIHFKDIGERIQMPRGHLVLDNHFFDIIRINGFYKGSAFTLTGNFHNLDKYISGAQERIEGSVNIEFDEFDLATLAAGKKSGKSKGGIISLPDVMLSLKLSGNKLSGGFGTLEDIRLEGTISPEKISIADLQFHYEKGVVKGNGNIFVKGNVIDSVNASMEASFPSVDIMGLADRITKKENPGSDFKLPEKTDLNLGLKIGHAELFGQKVNDVILSARYWNDVVTVKQLHMGAFDGTIDLTSRIGIGKDGLSSVRINGKADLGVVDLNTLGGSGNKNGIAKEKSEKQPGKPFALPANTEIALDLHAGAVRYGDLNLSNLKTGIQLKDDRLTISNLSCGLPFGKAEISLDVQNYPDASRRITGKIDLEIDTVDVNDLLAVLPEKDSRKEKAGSGGKLSTGMIPENVDLSFRVDAAMVRYDDFEAEALVLAGKMKNGNLFIDRLNFDAAGGSVDMHSQCKRNDDMTVSCYVFWEGDRLNLRHILSSFENFNQNLLTHENTIGFLSWRSDFYFRLDTGFRLIEEYNLWKLDLNLADAELIDNKPIEDALSFVGHKSKEKILISNLDFKGYMYKDRLIFKDILINNNISNMDFFGTYSKYDTTLDVHIQASLTDLFVRSREKRIIETEQGEINLDKDRDIFLNYAGPIHDSKVHLNSRKKYHKSRSDLEKQVNKVESSLADRKKKFEKFSFQQVVSSDQ